MAINEKQPPVNRWVDSDQHKVSGRISGPDLLVQSEREWPSIHPNYVLIPKQHAREFLYDLLKLLDAEGVEDHKPPKPVNSAGWTGRGTVA